MHIGIFGLSGAGKTSFNKWLSTKEPELLAISASKILKDAGCVISQEKIDYNNFSKNQEVLVSKYKELKKIYKNTSIELHAAIEAPSEKKIFWVPDKYLKMLELDAVIFLEVEPSELTKRRKADLIKKRPELDEKTLTSLQSLAIANLKAIYKDRLLIISNKISQQEAYLKISEKFNFNRNPIPSVNSLKS